MSWVFDWLTIGHRRLTRFGRSWPDGVGIRLGRRLGCVYVVCRFYCVWCWFAQSLSVPPDPWTGPFGSLAAPGIAVVAVTE